MTREEFVNLAKGQIVEYLRYWPSADRYFTERGRVHDHLGDGQNIIVSHRGKELIVHRTLVNAVKKSFYCE